MDPDFDPVYYSPSTLDFDEALLYTDADVFSPYHFLPDEPDDDPLLHPLFVDLGDACFVDSRYAVAADEPPEPPPKRSRQPKVRVS